MITAAKATDILLEMTKETSVDEAMAQMDSFLQRRSNRQLWSQIQSELDRRAVAQAITANIQLYSADADTDSLQQAISKYLDGTDAELTPSQAADRKDLIGGVLIEGQNTKLDLSVKKQLDNLSKLLNQ